MYIWAHATLKTHAGLRRKKVSRDILYSFSGRCSRRINKISVERFRDKNLLESHFDFSKPATYTTTTITVIRTTTTNEKDKI